jgi:hypothetical protein
MINFAKFEIIGRIGEIDARPKSPCCRSARITAARVTMTNGRKTVTGTA